MAAETKTAEEAASKTKTDAEAAEAKAAEEKAAAEAKEAGEEKPVNLAGGEAEVKPDPRAPENYEDFKFPEGVEADTTLLEGFTSLAKELDLPQAEAQKVIDFNKTIEDHRDRAWVKQTQDWADEIKADKELGGDSYDANLALVRQYCEKHGDSVLADMLNVGWGSNPGFFRLVLNFARAVGEDKIDDSGKGGPKEDTSDEAQLRRMYPTMFSEEQAS